MSAGSPARHERKPWVSPTLILSHGSSPFAFSFLSSLSFLPFSSSIPICGRRLFKAFSNRRGRAGRVLRVSLSFSIRQGLGREAIASIRNGEHQRAVGCLQAGSPFGRGLSDTLPRVAMANPDCCARLYRETFARLQLLYACIDSSLR